MNANRYISVITLSAIIGACNPSPQASPSSQAEIDSAVADAQEALAELEATKQELADTKKQVLQSKKTDELNPLADYDPEFAEPQSLCWQDYCPCESPETSLDVTICRNARGGIEMSDDQWSIGAMARDSKREGDRLNAEMDDILSDAR